MDINSIFNEVVTTTTLGGNQSRRRVGAAPSLRELKEGGYGIVDSNKPAPDARDSAADGDGDGNGDDGGADGEGGRFFADGLTAAEKGVLAWVDNMEDIDDALDRAAVQRL
ncbi:hypothetical protein H4R19_007285, partial [Coemansia spiralis]